MPRINARQKVLILIKKLGSATAKDVARILKTSSANARHHLAGLTADGSVEVSRLIIGRGRPEKLYRPSRLSSGDGLPVLVDALLASIPLKQQEQLWAESAKRLAVGNKAEVEKIAVRRLSLAIEHLNKLNYMARWEARGGGPQVLLENCPYFRVIEHQPSLCQMDGILLEKLLGGPVEQVAKLELGGRGLPHCIFKV